MRALITGITGQDGPYLADELTRRGDEVYGMVRGHRHPRLDELRRRLPGMRVVHGDLLDQSSLQTVLSQVQPDVVYNLGALTFVGMSWDQPTVMSEVTALGPLRMLEAIRTVNSAIRFVQASSSEMFGDVRETPQTETTPFHPRSPYGVAKTFAHHTTVNYRESYGIHASCAIMFNHESPERGPEFVTRKVVTAATRISRGLQNELRLGNLKARRDWGWAPDFVVALPLMSTQDDPGDYVLATGETHSVAELCDAAFAYVDLDWQDYVKCDPRLYRPADVELLLGYPWKARRRLGWEPTHLFNDVVRLMMKAELESL